jgi:hypothetical protein
MISVMEGQLITAELTLHPPGKITGTATYQGAPLANYLIDAFIYYEVPEGGYAIPGLVYSTYTDSSGAFSLGSLVPGDYMIQVMVPGMPDTRYEIWGISVSAGETVSGIHIDIM